MGCPSEHDLLDLVDGRLSGERRDRVREHLDECEACQVVAADLAAQSDTRISSPPKGSANETQTKRDSSPAPLDDPATALGVDTNRYELLQRLGQGGMGVVYAAHDHRLGRKVALKLLRNDVDHRSSVANAQARMLLEAKALARLSHPNVVTVYDAGLLDSCAVFLAMELIEGGDLRSWLSGSDRHWQDILSKFIAAGHGLAAAHAHGLVHRDFKPANVLVGSDGGVQVTDFGLARSVDVDSEAAMIQTGDSGPPQQTSSREELEVSLTGTGVVLGTPAYMAPEQRVGEEVDARSDQFSFCVSLFEALYGHRPFAGASPKQIVHAVAQGDIRRPDRKADGPPQAVLTVLERGLAYRPEQRWPSMEALLARLERALQPTPWVRWGLGSVVVVGVGGAIFTAGADEPRCRGLDAPIRALYDDAVRTQLGERFTTQSPVGEQAWQRVAPRLDRWSETWVAARVDACEATHVRGEQSEQMLDRRMECLDQRLREFETLLSIMDTVDESTVRNAVGAVKSLGAIEACSDPSVIAPALAPPSDPEAAERVAEIRSALARVRTMLAAGSYAEAVQVARRADARAVAVEHKPVMAEARSLLGTALANAGEVEDAERTLEEAVSVSLAAGHDEMLARSAARLVRMLGQRPDRDADFERMSQQASAAIQRVGGPIGAQRDLLSAQVEWAKGKADYTQASKHIDALAALEDTAGEFLVPRAEIFNERGDLLRRQGRTNDSIDMLRKALAARVDALGDQHPDVGRDLGNLGIALNAAGHPDEALEHFERAIEVLSAGMGRDNVEIGRLHNNVGMALSKLGRLEQAADHLARAIELKAEAHGPDSASLFSSYANLAIVERRRGHLDQAVAMFDEALTRARKAFEPTHPAIGTIHAMLTEIHLARGDLDQARSALATAEVVEHALGAKHPSAWGTAQARIAFQLASGDSNEALRSAKTHRAIVLADPNAQDEERAVVDALLGRAYLASGDRSESAGILESALSLLRGQEHPDPTSFVLTAWAAAQAGERECEALEGVAKVMPEATLLSAMQRVKISKALARCRNAGGGATERHTD